jgi:hypothetical protein
MRRSTLALASLLLLGSAPLAASAQPARPLPPISDVRVGIGPQLRAQAADYGPRDVDMLAADLKKDVENELRRAGRLGPGGARLELWITDATPNHPTQKQLADRPGLDYMRSVGKGGATIDGEEIQPNGARRHLHFDYTEESLRMARGQSTWGDAENVFMWFAHDYANGKR